MEKEEKMEKDGRPQRSRKAAPVLGGGSARCCAQGAVWAFPGQRPLAPSPGNHRGQCEAGLFGDVFAAGPVCLFSIIIIFFFFLAVDTSGVEKKEEISTVAHSDSGPQVRLWAAGTLQVGACGHWSWTLDVPGRGLYVGTQSQVVAGPGTETVGPGDGSSVLTSGTPGAAGAASAVDTRTLVLAASVLGLLTAGWVRTGSFFPESGV